MENESADPARDPDFAPSRRVVTIRTSGVVEFVDLYRAIRGWEGSVEGIVYEHILEGSGNIELPDGSRTPRVMIFVNGWRLSAEKPCSIVGGYVAGRASDGSSVDPIMDEAHGLIQLLGSEDAAQDFVPSEAQFRDALFRAAHFREDWIVDAAESTIRRKAEAPERQHSILGLYWYCKEQWLRVSDLTKRRFPISGDDQIPASGVIRTFTLHRPWSVPEEDRPYLRDGPLVQGDQLLVPAGAVPESDDLQVASPDDLRELVTVGVITALPKEYAAVRVHLQDIVELRGARVHQAVVYTLGKLEALNGGEHVVALDQCGMGNTRAAIRAARLIDEFPSLKYIIMAGIAGGVPHPERPDDHVRLGDLVASSRAGIVQYDMDKESLDRVEVRNMPLVPGPTLLAAVDRLEALRLTGEFSWDELLAPTAQLLESTRPDATSDRLLRTPATTISGKIAEFFSGNGERYVTHPQDPRRMEGVPRTFSGPIAAANKLLKNPVRRDSLRDRYGAKAVEMEGAGIAEASFDFNIECLVIRGVCDYCDEKKGEQWQGYASRVAAGFLTAVLRLIPD